MSDLTHIASAQPARSQPRLIPRLFRHLADLRQAHAKQALFATHGADIARDLDRPAEDVLGQNAYDPALPFFMQRSFGRP